MTSIPKMYAIVGQSNIIQHGLIYYNIVDCASSLYQLLEKYKSASIDNYKIVCYYGGVLITEYQITYNQGLVLYNHENYIQVSSLFPEFKVIDLLLGNLITDSMPNMKEIFTFPPSTSLENETFESKKSSPKKPRHTKLYHRFESAKKSMETKPDCSLAKNTKAKFDEEFESKKEKERISKIMENRTNEKFRMFISDKKSYQDIKQDINKGILKVENMHPYFLPKYQIFKILESRNAINFSNNDNMKEEYEIFSKLYDSYLEEEKEENDTCKVYVPHKYHYMTKEEKEAYAKKYNMTLESFEEKYINNTCNHDKIDTYINQKKSPMTMNIQEQTISKTESDDSSDETEDSETDDESIPAIDPKFIELTKEYINH